MVINASAVVTLHEQRPEKISGSERDSKFFSGLCSCSVTAALALMTVITQLLLWDKLLSIMLQITTLSILHGAHLCLEETKNTFKCISYNELQEVERYICFQTCLKKQTLWRYVTPFSFSTM